jgi:drug/metabolite transporter (DMT)-like permease
MNVASGAELIALAAIWGGSFLFLRLGAGEFGAVALAGLRCLGAALLLVPLLALRGDLGALRRHGRDLVIVGLTNAVIPFLCFAHAALSVNAGVSAIFNAASPLFAALLAWLGLKNRPSASRIAGLAIGFAGVVGLMWDKASFKPGGSGTAVLACLVAALSYGFAVVWTKQRLADAPPLTVSAGSQLAAAVVMAVPTAATWPAMMPSMNAWLAAVLLALVCTGLAHLMYFRLIAHIGPANAIAVTFLIPVFALLWGRLFLDEAVDGAMALGCAVVLGGTALATGLLQRAWPARAQAA